MKIKFNAMYLGKVVSVSKKTGKENVYLMVKQDDGPICRYYTSRPDLADILELCHDYTFIADISSYYNSSLGHAELSLRVVDVE